MAAAIRRLAENPTLRAQLGVAARNRVASEGLWSRKAEQMLDLYAEVLSARNESKAAAE